MRKALTLFKYADFVVVILTFGWLVRTPDWEPGIAFFVALVAFVTAHFFTKDHSSSPHSGNVPSLKPENQIYEFNVIRESSNRITVEIWYYYDGVFGSDDISFELRPLTKEGKPLPGGASWSGGNISIVGHKACTQIDYEYNPMRGSVPDSSCKMEVSMSYQSQVFCRRAFPFNRNWT